MRFDIAIQPEICLGCHACELACAVANSAAREMFAALHEVPLPVARISVTQSNSQKLPINCRHCQHPPCVDACIFSAMRVDDDGIVANSTAECHGCWMCVIVCPYGAVQPDYVSRKALKCNRDCLQSKDVPACVQACPTGALQYLQEEDWLLELRAKASAEEFMV